MRELPSARHLDTPTLNDHIPQLLDELAAALRSGSEQTIPEALRESTPPAHGLQRAHDDFDIEESVAESANLQTDAGVKIEPRQFDLWPLVEGIIQDMQPVAGTGNTRLINQVPDDLVVYADAALLRRALQNLIANAIRYTPGGEVVIDARESDGEGGAEVWVTDNGAGIQPDLLPRIFEKGETDPGSDGLGFGLTIVKTFIEAHGGKVTAQSKVGAGSTFRLSLPAKGKQTAAPPLPRRADAVEGVEA